MGNLVRACLGREYNLLHLQRRTAFSWDLLMIFKVIFYALFDVPPRHAYSSDEASPGSRSSPEPSPATLLRLLYRRHVLKSAKGDTSVPSRCQNFPKEKFASWKFSFDDYIREFSGSTAYEDKPVAATTQSRVLEILSRLNLEMQNLRSKLDKQEEHVQTLTEKMLSLQATATICSEQSSREGVLKADGVLSQNTQKCGFYSFEELKPGQNTRNSKAGRLVKLESMYLFQPVVTALESSGPDVSQRGSKNDEGDHASFQLQGSDRSSARKSAPTLRWESSLEDQFPCRKQSTARPNLECKGELVDRVDPVVKPEMEPDELDNLSMCSYDSADSREWAITPRCPRKDEFHEHMDWSSHEFRKDRTVERGSDVSWTSNDSDSSCRRRQEHLKPSDLEEKLVKILQSPTSPSQTTHSNPSSCWTSGASSPRTTGGQSEGRLYWEHVPLLESQRQGERALLSPGLNSDKKLNADLAAHASKTSRSLKDLEPLSTSSFVDECDCQKLMQSTPRLWIEQLERTGSSRVSSSTAFPRSAHANVEDIRGRSSELLPRKSDSGELYRDEVDIDEVSLQAYKFRESGDVHESEIQERNQSRARDGTKETDYNFCKDSQQFGFCCGLHSLRRHPSFGTRQSRFAVEAARLSMRKSRHHRGVSF